MLVHSYQNTKSKDETKLTAITQFLKVLTSSGMSQKQAEQHLSRQERDLLDEQAFI